MAKDTPQAAATSRIVNMRPDPPDWRDRTYSPTLRSLPRHLNAQPQSDALWKRRVKDQKSTSACTGFALSSLVEIMVSQSETAGSTYQAISQFMLYYWARRYDELPGVDPDGGSTARAAMKAWHKHGASSLAVWDKIGLTPQTAPQNWMGDGFRRPLGAYYRVGQCAIPDLHAALFETGVVYVTAQIHAGWEKVDANGVIPFEYGIPTVGGHAFLLVGYDEHGFWVQNSWGAAWGLSGFARLSYADWRANAMDAWIGQLGVNISSHVGSLGSGLNYQLLKQKQIATPNQGEVLLSSNPSISAQQISPYIVNLENNGRLSDSGKFATRPEDLTALVTTYLDNALASWQLPDDQPIKVAVYAHGGLNDENAAGQTAEWWIPNLFAKQIFPVFIMWETGIKDTLLNIAEDKLRGSPQVAGANLAQRLENWWNDRMESLFSRPGTAMWDEMKENARLASVNPNGGLRQFYEAIGKMDAKLRRRLEVHLIGHSAGAIFHAHLLPALMEDSFNVAGVHFMAPACRVDLFKSNIWPHFERKRIGIYSQFHMNDAVEFQDNCHPLPYSRSLLYLVSNAFEDKHQTPILGLQKFFDGDAQLKSGPQGMDWKAFVPPAVKEHGGFDDDAFTRERILSRIQRAAPSGTKPAGTRRKKS